MSEKNKNKKEAEGVVKWRAAEYEYFEKSINWYAIVILATFILVVFSLWQGNFFFAVFMILAGFMVVSLGKKKPRVLDLTINNKGVGVGKDDFYLYEDLEGFDVRENDHRLNEIIVKKQTTLNPFIKLRIDSNMMEDAVEILKDNLEKKNYEESAVDTVSDILRF
ncbi:MAG: hypothetical protein WDZ80_01615 [Candidatus Paceibacterota bacterium]